MKSLKVAALLTCCLLVACSSDRPKKTRDEIVARSDHRNERAAGVLKFTRKGERAQEAGTVGAPEAVTEESSTPEEGQPQVQEPAQFAGLPVFPGAEVGESQVLPGADAASSVTRAELVATAKLDEVATFYESALADAGWTVTTASSRPSQRIWTLAKDAAAGTLTIEYGDGKVTIKAELTGA